MLEKSIAMTRRLRQHFRRGKDAGGKARAAWGIGGIWVCWQISFWSTFADVRGKMEPVLFVSIRVLERLLI